MMKVARLKVGEYKVVHKGNNLFYGGFAISAMAGSLFGWFVYPRDFLPIPIIAPVLWLGYGIFLARRDHTLLVKALLIVAWPFIWAYSLIISLK